jgi:hypothetical protein
MELFDAASERSKVGADLRRGMRASVKDVQFANFR